ncbi:MAG: hypothetical protein RIC55_33180 [Pirellulaceae bacterium]
MSRPLRRDASRNISWQSPRRPTAINREARRQHHVASTGRIEAVRERFYAITIERRINHPAVLAISESAQRDLFA